MKYINFTHKPKANQQGFTIIELMISLSILSVILIISSMVMLQIGKLYSKGVNMANLQSATRNISSDIDSAVQFGGDKPTPIVSRIYGTRTIYAFCVGNVRYSFLPNYELGKDNDSLITTQHVMWRDTRINKLNCLPLDIRTNVVPAAIAPVVASQANSGYEMMPTKTRLIYFDISEVPSGSGLYRLKLATLYGDQNQFTTYTDSDPVDGIISPVPVLAPSKKASCKGGTGSQYCAISNVTTIISGRVQ